MMCAGRSAASSAARARPLPRGSPCRAGTGRRPRCARGPVASTPSPITAAPVDTSGQLARGAVVDVRRTDSSQQGSWRGRLEERGNVLRLFMAILKGRKAFASCCVQAQGQQVAARLQELGDGRRIVRPASARRLRPRRGPDREPVFLPHRIRRECPRTRDAACQRGRRRRPPGGAGAVSRRRHSRSRFRTSVSAAGSCSVRPVTSIWQNSTSPLPSRYSMSGLYCRL